MTRNKTYADRQQKAEPKPPALIAWHVAVRGEKSFWTRIGAAWDHKDGGGLTLQLDLVPVIAGRIVLRAPAEENAEAAKTG
ncbi:MAG: hypothetical protein ACKVP3_24155 [Hyphomicrobiaceae bacterium]